MKHFLLIYEFVPNYLELRPKFRDVHLAKAWAAKNSGDLVLAGALADPVDGAILIFKGDSPAAAEEFARTDPYVLNGLVKKWSVRPWVTVVGDMAMTPVHPTPDKATA